MTKTATILDSTQLSSFDTCPSLWHYEHDLRLDPIETKEEDTAISFGTYGHKIFDLYYKDIAIGTKPLEALEKAFAFNIDTICRCGHDVEYHGIREDGPDGPCHHIGCHCTKFHEVKFPLTPDHREHVQDRIKAYYYAHATDDFVPIGPESVELGFSHKLYEDDDVIYILEGRIDLIAKLRNGMKVFVDHKFQMRKHDLYTKSIQFRNYALVTGMTLGLINYVRLAKEPDKDTFKRDIISFSPIELELWRVELLKLFEQVHIARSMKDYSRRRSACPGRYGRQCIYTPLCDEIIPQVRSNKQTTLYKIRPEWKPW